MAATSSQDAARKRTGFAPNVFVDGYWLDRHTFYFIHEDWHDELGLRLPIPSLVDCRSGEISDVVPREALGGVLANAAGAASPLHALSETCFAMTRPDILTALIRGCEYDINVSRRMIIASRTLLSEPAAYAPNGRLACVVRDFNLWAVDCVSGAARALTKDGVKNAAYGRPSETGLTAISSATPPLVIWSPDSKWVVSHRIDETDVHDVSVLQSAPAGGGRPIAHIFKYATPGDSLPRATILAIEVDSGRSVTFPHALPVSVTSPLSAGHIWFAETGVVCVLQFDPYFRSITLWRFDLKTGEARALLIESTDSGNLVVNPISYRLPNVRYLSRSEEVIWFSERDGWGHLYLFDAITGRLKNAITRGAWYVRDIIHVSERARALIITAGGVRADHDRAHRTLCKVSFDGSKFQTLASHDGDLHVPISQRAAPPSAQPLSSARSSFSVSPDQDWCLITYGSLESGDETRLVNLDSNRHIVLTSAHASDEGRVMPVSGVSADDETVLYGALFLPPNFNASSKYPLVDFMYPGPQAPHKPQFYTSVTSTLARALARAGCVALMLDTRSTPLGPRAYRLSGYGSLLEPQLADHASFIKSLLQTFAFVNGDRIGAIGMSAGGAAVVRALCNYGNIYKAGVSVSGVHDPRSYTAMWANRYCGPDGLNEPANLALVDKLAGRLLLIAGEMDRNVLVGQTMALAAKLIEKDQPFEMLIVPNAGHEILISSSYVRARALEFLLRHLSVSLPSDLSAISKPEPIDVTMARMHRELLA